MSENPWDEPAGEAPGPDIAASGEEGARHRYVVGIDLGTTNSAVAYAEPQAAGASGTAGGAAIRTFPVPQLVGPGQLTARSLFSSFLYLPGTHELPPGSTSLPWAPDRDYAVGEFAREQGARVPARLVSSAKSWLCHGGVDRTAPILPWGGTEEVARISPVVAAARYLGHIREAWNYQMARHDPAARLEEQLVVLTVPASFDEVARELTVEAASQAGLPRVVLVEEPLAAFYAWLSRNEKGWQQTMQAGQLIWVCDVGGGTTDFTLVAIRPGREGLRFDRLAVGDHLMLGGDNMDLALGRHLEAKLMGKPGKLETNRWRELCHKCRAAKETLLGGAGAGAGAGADAGEDGQVELSILGAGGKLIAGTLRGTLSRREVEERILDGFFPRVSLQDTPEGGGRTGLTEWGLPYVQDPAVTRHLAAFWGRFEPLMKEETGRVSLYPDFMLFNGGALTPACIRNRILEVVGGWFQDPAGQGWSPRELPSPNPELAVAVGAAYYGLVRLGRGVRVGAGSPRAFYVEVDGPGRAAGADAGEAARRAVCIVPRGTEEGFEAELEELPFEVLANQPAAFQLASSSTRLGDRLGDRVQLAPGEITAFPPIRTVLRHGKKGTARSLPVQIAVKLTEVGTLELWCHARQSPHKWQLRFDVRQQAESDRSVEIPGETIDMASTEAAQEKIRAVFGREAAAAGERLPPESLVKALSASLLMKKEKWSTALIRKLADTLLENAAGRALSAQHEARWLNLLGFCMRPGFGDPVDEWRIKEAWKVFLQELHFPKQVPCRTEFWIFLRRIAGGLSAGQQGRIYQGVASAVLQPEGARKKKGDRQMPRRLNPQEELEVWMTLANLERLPAENKTALGRVLLERVRRKVRPQELWALSRLGARVPLYGPADRTVPSKEVAGWLKILLEADLPKREAGAHALVQLARLTGDRARDVPEKLQRQVSAWLEEVPQGERFLELLTTAESPWQREEQEWAFGESLPAGLNLTSPDP